MAYLSPNTFNTGIDRKIVIVDSSTGQQYEFSTIGDELVSFDPKPKHAQVSRKTISRGGREDVQTERYGWTGTIVVSRSGPSFELLEYAQELAFRQQLDPKKFTIHEQIRNRDGSGTTTKWRYESCDLRLSEGGQSALGQELNLTLTFDATDRVPE